MPAYLDHAATTPLRPEARQAMLPWLGEQFGNPSGSHRVARRARQAIDEARDVVAAAVGCAPGEVIFTGGGTEADNLAVFGRHRARPGRVLCSAIEHHAVLDPVLHLGGQTVPVDAAGVVDLDALREALDPSVTLVSVMLANNEVGTIEPLEAVARVVRKRAPEAVVHTDAVQAFSWLDVAALAHGAQLISLSAHKFGGPQGVGVLVVRAGTALAPVVLGGGQERGLRSGTHNVAGIVGMAAAMRATVEQRPAAVGRVSALRDRLVDGLLAAVPGAVETVARDRKVVANAHVCFSGVESEALLFLLDQAGIAASAASACASGALEPSHVLAAMGVPVERAGAALRLSLGATTTGADVDHALSAIPAALAQLAGVRLVPDQR